MLFNLRAYGPLWRLLLHCPHCDHPRRRFVLGWGPQRAQRAALAYTQACTAWHTARGYHRRGYIDDLPAQHP